MNFDIVTGIYRIERRPTAFVVYSLTNVAITVVMTVLLVVHWHHEAAGLMIGNFSGTYVTYGLMLIARRDVIGFRLWDRALLRRMLRLLGAVDSCGAGVVGAERGRPVPGQVSRLARAAGLVLGGFQDRAFDHAADRGVPDRVAGVCQLDAVRGRDPQGVRGGADLLVDGDGLGGGRDQPGNPDVYPRRASTESCGTQRRWCRC